MFCWNCGKEIEDGSKFCLFCGTSLDASKDNPVKDAAGIEFDESTKTFEEAAPAAAEKPEINDEISFEEEIPQGKSPAMDYSVEGNKEESSAPKKVAAGIDFGNMDLKTIGRIAALVGAAIVILASFLSFIKMEAYGESEGTSLMKSEFGYVGLLGIVFGAIAIAAILVLKDNMLYYAMSFCTMIYTLCMSSLMRNAIGAAGYGDFVKRGAGQILLIIGFIIMIGASAVMIMNDVQSKNLKK